MVSVRLSEQDLWFQLGYPNRICVSVRLSEQDLWFKLGYPNRICGLPSNYALTTWTFPNQGQLKLFFTMVK